MITSEEVDSINNAVERAILSLDNMYHMAELLTANKNALTKAIPAVDDASASNSLCLLERIPEKLAVIKEHIQTLANMDPNVSSVFGAFLQNEFVSYPWESIGYADIYTKEIVTTFVGKPTPIIINSNDTNAISIIKAVPSYYIQKITELEAKISALHVFLNISNIAGNIVMIGSNGSGKSTLSRQLRGKLSSNNNLTILAAQHLLTYSPKDSIPTSEQELQKVHNYHSQDKLNFNENSMNGVRSDMNQLISALIALHTDAARDYYDSASESEKPESILKKTVDLWKKLIKTRSLKIQRGSISVVTTDENEYPFNNLSDGEKAIFYYVGHILLAKEKSYIVVDEPENHLHVSICSNLWDTLEKERADCSFIYLTHDLNFASSRTSSTVIWNKHFNPPNNWDFEILHSMDEIPDSLLFELVGSKRDVCFCEGDDQSSIDYQLYSALLPDYHVIPVGGHDQVISYTKAYNSNATLFRRTAIGIIDRDCHEPGRIDEWSKKGIFAITVFEAENILCDERVLDEAIEQFRCQSDAKQKFMDLFWQELEIDKERLALLNTKDAINELFRSNCLKETGSIETLKAELITTLSEENAEELYRNYLLQLEDALARRDYGRALEVSSLKKKLTRRIACITIVNDYEERILSLLKESGELVDILRAKHLSGVSVGSQDIK